MTPQEKIKFKIRALILCLEAHPDNEPDSEFADRLSDLYSLESDIEDYVNEKLEGNK